MRRGINPLFPASPNRGLNGAYEQAVLMDDTDAVFDKKRRTIKSDLEFIAGTEKSYREFSRNHRESMNYYRESLKQLKQQKKTGKITQEQFRIKKKKLVKETDLKNLQIFKNYLLGK